MSTSKGPEDKTQDMNVLTAAENANAQEHELSVRQALHLYPKSVMWSFILSTSVIMEGYDTKLIGTLFAQPTFRKAFGHLTAKGTYEISAPWQSGLGSGGAAGQVIGLMIAGTLSEKYGFRKSLIGGLASMIALIFITFFAHNLIMLEVGQVLFGIPLGLFQTTTVIYALEVAPVALRAYLTNYVNFCWAFGQIIATGVLRGTLNMTSSWAYRIPFAIQWVWPVILIPLIYFAPESPWWLVRKNRLDDARAALVRLTSDSKDDVPFDFDKNIALMVATTEHERAVNASTTYMACFQGANLRRTVIAVGVYCIQVLNGNPLRGYSTYFLQQAGMATTQSFNMTIVGFAVAIIGGFFSWVLLPLFGRRTIYVWSVASMLVIMTIIGALGVPQAESPNSSYAWAIGSILIVSSFIYNCSLGPLTNTLCAELASALLRSKTIVLARTAYTITSLTAGILTPYQLNATAWGWGAKTGFFWAGGCLISLVFAFFMVPEPKGRTTAEIDILFERRVSARKFSETSVDLIEELVVSGDLKV